MYMNGFKTRQLVIKKCDIVKYHIKKYSIKQYDTKTYNMKMYGIGKKHATAINTPEHRENKMNLNIVEWPSMYMMLILISYYAKYDL